MGDNLENLKDNSSSWGGARDNAGRPKGSENEETKKRRVVEKAFKQRVLRSADELINSQMSLAKGVQMLYCIEKDKDGKNKKPRLVDSQQEIEEYLEGNYDNNKDYYFITTERPDNRAIDSLFDRVFGRATQPSIDLTPRDEPDIIKMFQELKKKANDDETNNTTINKEPA